jgi:hypothetical protein
MVAEAKKKVVLKGAENRCVKDGEFSKMVEKDESNLGMK